MKETTRYTIPQQTRLLIASGRIKDAMTFLRRRLTESPQPGGLTALSRLESTYRFMLQYLAGGGSDPDRDKVLADIRTGLLDIADTLQIENEAVDSSELYYSTLRFSRLRPADIEDMIATVIGANAEASLAQSVGSDSSAQISKAENAESHIFDMIWTGAGMTPEKWNAINENLRLSDIGLQTSAMAVAAAYLGLMKAYSRERIFLLIDAATSTDPRISARAIVSLVLAVSTWSERIADDRKVIDRLMALIDMPGMDRRIKFASLAAIYQRDTEKVSAKMRNEVMPGLMQFGPDIMKRFKEASQTSSLADLEENPEWEQLLQNSGLDKKLQELTEMQMNGADVLMMAFSNLKSFPFFRQIRNWFMPFDSRHSSVSSLFNGSGDNLIDMMDLNTVMCDSDKYSYLLSLSAMPEAQRMAMTAQLGAQVEQMKEIMAEKDLHESDSVYDSSAVRYVRDLYRFHRLFPKKSEFIDPFVHAVSLLTAPVLSDATKSTDTVMAAADFLFRRGYHADALPLLQYLSANAPEYPRVWEKIGFCLEKTSPEDPKEAVEAYMKAQLFNPDSKWLAKRLAICHRELGNYRDALEAIANAMPDDGYDERLTLMLADINMEASRWEDALKALYRVDYESPGNPPTMRRMARCLMHKKDFVKATEMLRRISPLEISEEDRRMLGHLALLQGDTATAMDHYRTTVRPNDEKRLWKSMILGDSDMLEKLGIDRRQLILILEALSYSLESQ